jgi:hypothetical protein
MSILGRRRGGNRSAVSEPSKPRTPRAARPPRRQPPDSRQPALDPMKVWREFRPNTLLWARWWLANGGELPASCHRTIADRLALWKRAVTEGDPEMRASLLAVVPPIPPREPEPARAWTMPPIEKTYSMERESDETDQVDEQAASEAAEAPEKPCGVGRGGVTQEPGDVRHPSTGVTHQEGGVVAFPLPEGNRECAACGRAFKPYRKEAAFCSGGCRQRAYRERKGLWRRPQNDRGAERPNAGGPTRAFAWPLHFRVP